MRNPNNVWPAVLGVCLFCLVLAAGMRFSFLRSPALYLAGYLNQTALKTDRQEPTPEATPASSPEPAWMDYVELMRYPSAHRGEQVRIVGRIGRMDSQAIYFVDRLNYYVCQEEEGRADRLKIYPEDLPEDCRIGDYVAVEGQWNLGIHHPYLSKGRILFSGQEARERAQAEAEAWKTARLKQAADIPLTDYLLLQEQAEELEEKDSYYVRTAVVIAKRVYSSGESWSSDRFSVRNERNGAELGTVTLTGNLPEVLAACQDGESVIVSGLLMRNRDIFCLEDCFVEEVGGAAKEETDRLAAVHREAYAAERAAYLASCVPFDYQTMVRRPEEFRDTPVVLKGRVTELSDGDPLGASLILKLEGSGRQAEIYYGGGALDDLRILQGDRFTAYGTLRDVSYQEQEDGSKLELPYIRAEYADWGEE